MAVTKKIEIDGKEVEFRASAAVPRLYRLKFGRDIYKDLRMLEKSVGENDEDDSSLDLFSLEMFENIAFIMAKHASPPSHQTERGLCLKNVHVVLRGQLFVRIIIILALREHIVHQTYREQVKIPDAET